jgi:hypothetical protein
MKVEPTTPTIPSLTLEIPTKRNSFIQEKEFNFS